MIFLVVPSANRSTSAPFTDNGCRGCVASQTLMVFRYRSKHLGTSKSEGAHDVFSAEICHGCISLQNHQQNCDVCPVACVHTAGGHFVPGRQPRVVLSSGMQQIG